MNVRVIDPLSDSRWDDFVARHPKASVFHQRGWLEALALTYGYKPLVLTTTPTGHPLRDGLALCHVSSWITGSRLVSLPFSDHCEPLVDDVRALLEITAWLRHECDQRRSKYVELRPLSQQGAGGFSPESNAYWLHLLDLTPSLNQIFQGFHKDSVQRRIRRAEKAGLSYEKGRSEKLAEEFYRLLVKTRRRHQLFPQPRAWFKNIFRCLGCSVQIRLARRDGIPIAAVLTLERRSSMVYKYGCSDARFHHVGGMPFIFWRLIEESKAAGATELDFGRSEIDNDGLVSFKDHFGAKKKRLNYLRYPHSGKPEMASRWDVQAMRRVVSLLPDGIMPVAGKILYRHIG